MKRVFVFTAIITLAFSACNRAELSVSTIDYGILSDGVTAHKYLLTNNCGSTLSLTDFGARIISISVPDRNGVIDDVIVGPDDLATFESGKPERFLGCVIGRFGNRINHASFTLDGVTYELEANEESEGVPVQCHGASKGFDRFLWEGETLIEDSRVGVRFHRLSPDGEAGFPGNCDCFVTYWLTNDNVVRVEYSATTDKPTVINLSNHSFFNLKGHEGGYVMDRFPSTVLRPGETYSSVTEWRFYAR